MSMHSIYLDHNIIDEISKGGFSLPSDSSFLWVYSNEHFAEIERSGDTRFIDVLRDLKAQKLELKLNNRFQITGEAHLCPSADPHVLFEAWCEAQAEVPATFDCFSTVVSRLFGAANEDALAQLPNAFERDVATLLSMAGLLDESHAKALATARAAVCEMITEHLAERPHLESQRVAFGTHGGRGSNLADHENPLESLWELMREASPEIAEAVTQTSSLASSRCTTPVTKVGLCTWVLWAATRC